MFERMPKPVLIALGIGVVVLIAILILNGNKPQTITPATGTGSNPGTGAGGTDTASAIAALEAEISAMPAGVSQDQLKAALDSLSADIQSGNVSNIANLESSLVSMQQAIQQSGADNTTSLQAALTALADSVTQSNSGLQSYLQSQVSTLEQYSLPSIPLSSINGADWWNAFGHVFAGTNWLNLAQVNGTTVTFANNQWDTAMNTWIAGLIQMEPGLKNVPSEDLQNLFYNIYINNKTQAGNPTFVTQQIQQAIKGWAQSGLVRTS